MNKTPSKSRTRINASRIDERTTPSTYYLDHQQNSRTQSYSRSRTASRPGRPIGRSFHRAGQILGRGVVAIVFVFFAMKDIYTANSARNWRAVQGEIISKKAEIVKRRFTSDLEPSISYKYKVNGQVYISDRIQIGRTSGDAKEILDKYPGKNVTVYFDPDTPSEATLDRNLNQSNILILFGLAILMIVLLKFDKTY